MAQQPNLFDARIAPAQLRFSARHGGLILAYLGKDPAPLKVGGRCVPL